MRVSFIHRMSKKKKMSEEKKDAVSSLFVCGKFSMLSLSLSLHAARGTANVVLLVRV